MRALAWEICFEKVNCEEWRERGWKRKGHTDLSVYQLCQCADELRRRVVVGGGAFVVDELPD